ncbi:LIM homeobox transcription factor 1-beta-like isoform X2 [Oscarella lobularis]
MEPVEWTTTTTPTTTPTTTRPATAYGNPVTSYFTHSTTSRESMATATTTTRLQQPMQMEHRPPIRLQTTPVADHLRHHRYPVCDACGTVIFERYFVRVAEKTYHERCLRCCICRVQLSASCYYKHNQFYCKIDYQRMFGTKCSACGESIPSTDLVMRAMDNVYHLRCFACVACGQPLQRGDEYVLQRNQLYCKLDGERMQEQRQLQLQQEPQQQQRQHQHSEEAGTVFSLHHYPPPPPPPPPPPSQPMHAQAPGGMQPPFPVQYPLSLPGPSDHPQQRPIYGRPLRAHDDVPFGFSVPGPKRPRTILTGSQRHLFKTTFEQNPKPSRKMREKLSQDTGLSVRVVQVWFQNQRAKVKKLSKKKEDRSESISSQLSGGDGSPATKGGDKGIGEGSSGSESSSGDITLMSGSPALQSSVHAEGFALHEAAAAATTRTTIASGGLRGESAQQTSSQRGDCQLHASAVAAAAADDSDPLQLLHSMQSHYFSEQQK